MKAISLYTGVGGLDYGFEAAGIKTAVAVELDPLACMTLRLNREWPVLEGDIANITSSAILGSSSLAVGEADVLIGGPPCQPFSKSSYWATGDAGRLDDPRAGTLHQYLRVLRDTLPHAFLIENVPGLAFAGKSEGLESIRGGIATINRMTGSRYSMHVAVLNAAEFGVPQLRERLFVIGSRDGLDFAFPTPTHASIESAAERGLEPYLTAWDALGDLPAEPNDVTLTMTGKWADLLASIPEGQNYLWHTNRGGGSPLFGWRTRFWNFLLKLSKDRPSWTIQAQPGPATGPFHWQNRKLSVSELGRLQTLPEGLTFDCTRAEAQRLIGNAVPSALAEILATEIRVQLLGGKRSRQASSLLPARRLDRPASEPAQPIPQKYLSLLGEHAEHPGTGRGRRALERLRQAA